MTDPDQLPPELADLFAAERTAPTTTASVRTTIRSRLAAVLVGVPLGAAASALGGAGKLLSVIAIAVAAGGGTIAVVHHASTASPATRSVPLSPALESAMTEPTRVVSSAQLPAPPAPRATALQATAAPPTVAQPTVARATRPLVASPVLPVITPVTEPELVRDAWTALSSNDAPRALQITERAAELYPVGGLDEERDAVRIVALAKLHRVDEAEAAAARFSHQHPTSVHRALIERALHDEDSP